MSSTHEKQPEKHGGGAHASGRVVAVRDGNRLLCPCCGEVLMVLTAKPAKRPRGKRTPGAYPLDSEGLPRPQSATLDEISRRQEAARSEAARLEEAVQAASAEAIATDEPGYRADGLVCPIIDPQVEAYQVPAEDPPPLPPGITGPRPRDNETRRRERQRYRLKRPLRQSSTYEGKRLRAWYFYRLKAFDLQLQREIREQVETIQQLRRKLDDAAEGVSNLKVMRLPAAAKQTITPRRRKRARQVIEKRHAHADVSMAPNQQPQHQRGPP